MRPFSETLPTLRESGNSRSDPGQPAAAADFDPSAILKALNARAATPARVAPGGAPPTGSRAAVGRDPFDPSQLPRKSATKLPDTAFAKTLAAAIEPFDKPARAPAKAQAEPDPDGQRETAERERIAEMVRAEEQRKLAVALEEERTRWVEEIGERLSEQLDQAFVDLHNRLADAITEALKPVMEEAMRAKAVARFSAGLQRLTGRAEGTTVQPIIVHGPPALLNALTAARSGDTAGLKLVASDDCELVASVNETTLRTTIKAWASALSAAAGSRHGKE